MLFAQIPQLKFRRPGALAPRDPRSSVHPAASEAVMEGKGGWQGAATPPPLYDRPGYGQGVPPTNAATVPRATQSEAKRIFTGAILSLLDD